MKPEPDRKPTVFSGSAKAEPLKDKSIISWRYGGTLYYKKDILSAVDWLINELPKCTCGTSEGITQCQCKSCYMKGKIHKAFQDVMKK